MLDDTPVVPGADRAEYEHERAAKEILLDAEEELGKWQPSRDLEYTPSHSLDNNLLPSIGNGSVTESVTGQGDERARKTETNSEPATGAYSYDPKVLQTAT